MKILILVCYLMPGGFLFAQQPIGAGGKDLFQKGDCKEIIRHVKYECEFCEDKELTKNCKKYDCSITECKEQAAIGSNRAIVNIEGKQVRMANNSTKPAGRMDITSEFASKKVKKGTVLIYKSEGNDKIYGVYKKSQLQEWYVITAEGKKLMPSPDNLQGTTCQSCVVLPNQTVVCSNCSITPGISDGVKSQH